MPRLRALTSWADRKAGEEFDASDDDARLLCAPDLAGGQKARIIDRAMQAEPEQPDRPKAPAPRDETKRRYLRRDMRAQN